MSLTNDAILAERGADYGDFRVQWAIAQRIKDIYRQTAYEHTLSPHQAEALDMVATKISRILVGDANIADHWRDIAGYTTLVAEDLDGLE